MHEHVKEDAPQYDEPSIDPIEPPKALIPPAKEPTYTPAGNLSIVSKGENYSGCAVREFENAEHLEKYFEQNRGFLILEMFPTMETITCVYSRVMSAEYHSKLMKVQELVQIEMAKFEEAEQTSAAKNMEAEEERLRKEKKLVEVGRRCEEHHASLIEENQKLRKQVKAERKKGA